MYLQLMYLQLMYLQLMYLQSHIYKKIPVSFDFITTWNQGAFLYSPCIYPNKMHMLQISFYMTTAPHVSGVTITPSSGAQTTVTTAFGNRYTVTDRVKFADNEYL